MKKRVSHISGFKPAPARGAACLVAALVVWLPAMHLVFRPDIEDYVSPLSTRKMSSTLHRKHLRIP